MKTIHSQMPSLATRLDAIANEHSKLYTDFHTAVWLLLAAEAEVDDRELKIEIKRHLDRWVIEND